MNSDITNGRVLAVEAWLDEHGISEFEYRDSVLYSEIDRDAGKHNRARMAAVDEDRVVLIAEAIEAGDDVGPVVLYKRPRKKLLDPLDGNHRLEAGDLASQRSTAAYVITQELTETQEWFLIGTANKKHGQPATMEDRVLWAVNTIEKFGISQAQAAKIVGVPATHVSRRVQQIEGQRRFTALIGERRIRQLQTTKLARLNSIHSDTVAKQAAELAADAKLAQEDVNRLCVAINKARDENDQLRIIQSVRDEVQSQRSVTVEGKVDLPLSFKRAQRLVKTIENFDFQELRETHVDSKLRKQIVLKMSNAAALLAVEVQKF